MGEHHVAKHLGLPHLIEIVETTHLEVEQAVLWPSSSPLSRGIASLRVFDIIDVDKGRQPQAVRVSQTESLAQIAIGGYTIVSFSIAHPACGVGFLEMNVHHHMFVFVR